MHPATLLRELRNGHAPVIRVGLSSLVLGALTVALVVTLLSPAMNGLTNLPGHELGAPTKPRYVPPPVQLTAAQKAGLRRAAVIAAVHQVGVRERAGGGNRGPAIVAYRRAVTRAGENARAPEPWCADFVSWVWKRAGYSIGFGGAGEDYVPSLVAWAKLSRRWHATGHKYRPRPGDLVVYTANGLRFGHVGMVVKVGGGHMKTIEGNFGDKVSRRVVRPWAPGVRGFITPV